MSREVRKHALAAVARYDGTREAVTEAFNRFAQESGKALGSVRHAVNGHAFDLARAGDQATDYTQRLSAAHAKLAVITEALEAALGSAADEETKAGDTRLWHARMELLEELCGILGVDPSILAPPEEEAEEADATAVPATGEPAARRTQPRRRTRRRRRGRR